MRNSILIQIALTLSVFTHTAAADAPRLFEHLVKFTSEGFIANQLVPIEIKLNEGESLYAIKTTPSNNAKCLSMKDPARQNVFYLKCSSQSTVSLQIAVQSQDIYYTFTIPNLMVKNPSFRSPTDQETVIVPPPPIDVPSQAARDGKLLWTDNGCVACHSVSNIGQNTWYATNQNANANGGKGDGIRNQFQRVTPMNQFLTLTNVQLEKIAAYFNERNKNFNQ